MPIFDHKAVGFLTPTALPGSPVETEKWQAANRAWWEKRPMRYDWRDDIEAVEFSRDYYRQIDDRFLQALQRFLPWKEKPFDDIIDFAALKKFKFKKKGKSKKKWALLALAAIGAVVAAKMYSKGKS